jgi:hypothetical protein
MIRVLQKADIERVVDIWLDINLKAHYFIPELSLLHIPQDEPEFADRESGRQPGAVSDGFYKMSIYG